jgi:hypothetical protein
MQLQAVEKGQMSLCVVKREFMGCKPLDFELFVLNTLPHAFPP